MKSNSRIREIHRWLGIVLTLAILANFAAMALGKPSPLVVYFPLAPLALLLMTGLYMFAQPYRARSVRSRAE